MKTHYIAMSGLHGCLPQYISRHDTREEAIGSLSKLHELGKIRTRVLRKGGSLELYLMRDGAEYCEVTECNCDTPDIHD